MPGVEPFFQPEVVKKLDLSAAQQEAIERLKQITQIGIADLEKYFGDDSRLEVAQKRSALLDEARQRALQLLTKQQQALWASMMR